MLSLTTESCELFNIPFYQFAQMKKLCEIFQRLKRIIILAESESDNSNRFSTTRYAFCVVHIESWTNGWQVRAHFLLY